MRNCWGSIRCCNTLVCRPPWQPATWLDVLEPLVGYLLELPRRFQQTDTWQEHKAGGHHAVNALTRAD